MKTTSELQSQLARARSPSDVHELLFAWERRSSEAISMIAGHAAALDAGLIALVLESGNGADALVKNPSLDHEGRELILRWCMNRLGSEAAIIKLEQSERLLIKLAQMGAWSATGPWMDELVDIVTAGTRTMANRQVHGLEAALAHPDVRPETVAVLTEQTQARLNAELLTKLATHPKQSAEARRTLVLDHIVAQDRLLNTVHELMQVEAVRLDPKIRPELVSCLMKASPTPALKTMVEDGRPEDCRGLFLKLLVVHETAAVRALRDHPELIAPHLTREDLAPLLSSEIPEARAAALAALAHLRGVGPEVTASGSERRPGHG